MAAYERLNAENCYIWRIVHRSSVPWIPDHGLVCANAQGLDPRFVSIGNPDLIARRTQRVVPIPPGGTLSDYVPFYFTPFSPIEVAPFVRTVFSIFKWNAGRSRCRFHRGQHREVSFIRSLVRKT
ncbi:DarT ssDNA thymidine ADP-ribosyltransferase family protein [Paraburkholderia megapolitana]|uniref:DarT ssDNA thymidine ADP-ribosyltransferase family protein n=1 Tax=Paraburkholderia megapolitana TaxID=420953 RepID=UPI0038BCD343